MKILNVEITDTSLDQATTIIDDWISHSKTTKFVVTPNPEILLLAKNDPKYRQILNSADLSIPDGTGIIWASKKYQNRLKNKVTGIDLIEALANEGVKKRYRWFLLGGKPGIAKQASNKIENKFPGNKIIKAIDGGNIGIDNFSDKKNLVDMINKLRIDILVVCFGAPKQEMFINYFKNNLNVKVAIGAGGSLDFISGKRKRAPKLLRKIGLEWLWRLVCEPRRFRRIYRAVVKFPLAVRKDLKK